MAIIYQGDWATLGIVPKENTICVRFLLVHTAFNPSTFDTDTLHTYTLTDIMYCQQDQPNQANTSVSMH